MVPREHFEFMDVKLVAHDAEAFARYMASLAAAYDAYAEQRRAGRCGAFFDDDDGPDSVSVIEEGSSEAPSQHSGAHF